MFIQVQQVVNKRLRERWNHRRREVSEENHNHSNDRMLFHGSPFVSAIVQKGEFYDGLTTTVLLDKFITL